MRFGLALVLVLAGCGFHVDAGVVDADLTVPDRPDLPDPDAARDADVTVDAAPRFCEPDASLRR
jgi:hypothetical protein